MDKGPLEKECATLLGSLPAQVAILAVCGVLFVLSLRAVTDYPIDDQPPSVGVHLQVDLNTADVAELALLPNIGVRTAEKIIADRTTNGRYENIEDLLRVPGIGPTTLHRLTPYIVAQ